MKVALLRPDAHAIDVYNSGPVIFVYDEAHRAAIAEASPSLLEGFHGDPEQDVDAALRGLGERGFVAVFAMYQDDELCAELALGPPLDDPRYGAPQRTYLRVTRGPLCIESYDALAIVDGAEPTDQGARVDVPPGDYVLSVQALTAEQDPDALVPEHYLSLQPAGAERPVRPFLPHPSWGWEL